MTRKLTILATVLCALPWVSAQDAPPPRHLLTRRYQEGEKLIYRMKGVNQAWRYEIQATGVVKKDSAGKYTEEYAWSNPVSNGEVFTLPPASARFRQVISLDPEQIPAIPNLAEIHPTLIGPVTDLLTFYCDLWLPIRLGKLARAGDHFYRERGAPASWADGHRVVLGEDSIDFDVTLAEIDESSHVATLVVRHLPPRQPNLRLPAAWMREPVAGTPNNWVQVAKTDKGFEAAVGKETFDVRMSVSLADGRILSGTIENPVITRERDCRDAALADCGEPRSQQIMRRIEISLVR